MPKIKLFLLVAILTIVNYFLVGRIFGDIGFNLGRILLAGWGGWHLVAKSKSNLYFAAMLGIFILVIDHVLLKGDYFLVAQVFSPDSVQNKGIQAFYGVLLSFAMFASVAVLISLAGGFIGRGSTTTQT